jgi:hypothetical protein
MLSTAASDAGMHIDDAEIDGTPATVTASQSPPLENPVDAALKKNRDAALCQ